MTFVIECADAYEILPALPADSFDVTITDPPYDAHCQENQSSGTAMKRAVAGRYHEDGRCMGYHCTRDSIDHEPGCCNGQVAGGIPRIELPFAPIGNYAFVADLLRVTRRWVLVFCAVEALGEIRGLYPKEYIRGCIWYKPNSMGQLTGDRPAAAFEAITLLHRVGKKRWNGRGSFGIWKCNGTRGEKDRHPNQKPLRLLQKLVALFSEPGETIFDPFCGSGRIGEATLSLGRRYVGIEKDPEWALRAAQRCSDGGQQQITQEAAMALCNLKDSDQKELEP